MVVRLYQTLFGIQVNRLWNSSEKGVMTVGMRHNAGSSSTSVSLKQQRMSRVRMARIVSGTTMNQLDE